jgi:dUTP pyrophosphatase
MIRERVEIQPKAVGYVLLNIACETPEGHFLLVAARSSIRKKGLMPVHGIGIGDSDFRGDQDEYPAPYFNFTDKPVTIERGGRIAQGAFIKIEDYEWEEVDQLGDENRGGFGSTGNK